MVNGEVVKARNALHEHPVLGCGCAVFGFLVSFRYPPDHSVPLEAFIVDQSNILEFFSVFGRRAKLLFDKGSAFSRFSIICCILSVFLGCSRFINCLDVQGLQLVNKPKLGPARCQLIFDERQRRGAFTSADDLKGRMKFPADVPEESYDWDFAM